MSKVLEEVKMAISNGTTYDRAKFSKLSEQEKFNVIQYTSAFHMKDFEAMRRVEMCFSNLDAGGIFVPPEKMMRDFQYTSTHRWKQLNEGKKLEQLIPGVDSVSEKNMCRAALSSLSPCTITHLRSHHKGKVAVGKVLWVTSLLPVYPMACINVLVKDDEGTIIQLSLYNIGDIKASEKELNLQFPVGLRMALKHPYLKLSNGGFLALRVDNPCNVEYKRNVSSPSPSPSSINPTSADSDASSTEKAKSTSPVLSPEELKVRGNASFKANHFEEARVSYSVGASIAKQLLETLYSNRAICYLKLFDYIMAERDCEAVLELNSTHEKALRNLNVARAAKSGGSIFGFGSMRDYTEEVDEDLLRLSMELDYDELKELGNESFKIGNFTKAMLHYTTAIGQVKNLLEQLYGNSAIVSLRLRDYASARKHCEDAPSMKHDVHARSGSGLAPPENPKMQRSLKEAKKGLAMRQQQRLGKYDFLTFPMKAVDQSREENYYGPIEVRSAGRKGRGLFVTRDVMPGELLFAEKALVYGEATNGIDMLAMDFSTDKGESGSQHNALIDLIKRASKDDKLNAQLSCLAYDNKSSNTVIPIMDAFRTGTFESVPTLSAGRIKGVMATNCFEFSDEASKTMAQRQELQDAYFGSLGTVRLAEYSNREQPARMKRKKDQDTGSVLMAVGSFMNHTADESECAYREFFGSFLFVVAARVMREGDEVLTNYGEHDFGEIGVL